MPPTAEATGTLNPVYTQAQQAIQSQTPAIQNLYSALIQGLQAQSAAQAQNVVNSANARGVGRASLPSDIQGLLGDTLAIQTGQLGVQQAQDIAANQQSLGKLGVQQVGNVNTLAQSLQDYSLGERRAQIAQNTSEQQYQMDLQKADRQDQIRQAAYRTSQAAAAAKADTLTSSQALEQIGSLWKVGKDGYVNPKQWDALRKAYIDAGYSAESFNSAFKSLANPAHQHRTNTKKLPRYSGLDIKK